MKIGKIPNWIQRAHVSISDALNMREKNWGVGGAQVDRWGSTWIKAQQVANCTGRCGWNIAMRRAFENLPEDLDPEQRSKELLTNLDKSDFNAVDMVMLRWRDQAQRHSPLNPVVGLLSGYADGNPDALVEFATKLRGKNGMQEWVSGRTTEWNTPSISTIANEI